MVRTPMQMDWLRKIWPKVLDTDKLNIPAIQRMLPRASWAWKLDARSDVSSDGRRKRESGRLGDLLAPVKCHPRNERGPKDQE